MHRARQQRGLDYRVIANAGLLGKCLAHFNSAMPRLRRSRYGSSRLSIASP